MADCQKKKETSKKVKFLKFAGVVALAGGAGYVLGNEKARTAVASSFGKVCAAVVNIFKKNENSEVEVDTTPDPQPQPQRREFNNSNFGHRNGYNKPHYTNK